jgi:hypothetical protein
MPADILRAVVIVLAISNFIFLPLVLPRFYRTNRFWWLYFGVLFLLAANVYGRIEAWGNPHIRPQEALALCGNICLLTFATLVKLYE